MFHWLIDHALLIYVLLGVFVLGFLLVYRNNRDRRALIAVCVLLGSGLLVFLLTLLIVTDRQQIERNLHALRDAALNNRPAEMRKYFAADFAFRKRKVDEIVASAPAALKAHRVNDITLGKIRFETIGDGKAKIFFNAAAHQENVEFPQPVQCEGEFTLEGGVWKMKSFEVYPPVGRTPLPIPGL
jgi:hypothetical protein